MPAVHSGVYRLLEQLLYIVYMAVKLDVAMKLGCCSCCCVLAQVIQNTTASFHFTSCVETHSDNRTCCLAG